MEDEVALRKLQESIDSNPNDPGPHFNLGLFLWEKGKETREVREKAAEHFLVSAKLNPQNGTAFRYLGHYYSQVTSDNQRALKCYQRAVTLSPDDSESGEALCDLLDAGGKESLEVSVCREASEKSPRAFWAFRILGYLQVHQKKWSEAVPNLQHAIRGYPSCADLWEALGLAYQRLGMYTAAIKSYGRATELEGSRVFALIESGNIHLILGSFRKGIEQFQQALQISPQNVSAQYGLASALLSLSKECMISGAFMWGASLLEKASNIAKASTCSAGNISCIWKLHGDILVAYAKCLPWMEKDVGSKPEALKTSILSWKTACQSAALSACSSYQRALHLAPWQANIYVDIAIASDLVSSFKQCSKGDPEAWQLPEKMSLGGLLLEGDNNEFWVALGCLSCQSALKQHAFIRGLQIDISFATAWAHLGKFYREEGDIRLAIESFDRARSIDPSLALPWAGMAADSYSRELTSEEAYESCLRAVQNLPLAEFQIGLAKFAMLSGQLSSSQVFGAIQQAIQRAPHYPESHNLRGLVYEAQHDYWSAIISYRLARCAISISAGEVSKSYFRDVSTNLARSLCKAGNALDAVNECEELIKEGMLDLEGLQIYALSLWQLGRTDVLLYVIKDLVSSTITTQGTSKEAPVSLICRLLYYISGLEAAVSSILKMPHELFESSKVSFVVSAIHALDRCNQLEAVVSRSRRSLLSHEEITRMHFLIALSKLVKNGSKDSLAIQSGVQHLRKVIHMYPNNDSIRNLLGYLQLSGEAGRDTRSASRCVIIPPSGHLKEEGLISSEQILGASVVACYTTANCKKRFTFPTCECQLHETRVTKQLQRLLHQEPWNNSVRCLLIVNYLQKAREERFPRHLCDLLGRLVNAGLSNKSYSNVLDRSWQYQRFQLLLCASEISLLGEDIIGCVNHAKNASRLIVSDNYLFFAHLQLCRAYAAESNFSSLHQEYIRCLELKTDYPIGWICLKFIESLYELQTGSNQLQLYFEASIKDLSKSSHMWRALFSMVHGFVSIWTKDFVSAEESLAQACSLAGAESCFFLCHGVVCMELARQLCDSQFVSRAIRSFKKAKDTSIVPLPLVSLLLGQAEASLGSKEKWEKNLRVEWYSWPQEMRPAELYLQMHLLSLQPKELSDSSFKVELCLSPRNWILRAIHLNPSCSRYWKVLQKFLNE